MTEDYTHFVTVCRANGEILGTFFIGGIDGCNLSKRMGRIDLVDEIAHLVDLDSDDEIIKDKE